MCKLIKMINYMFWAEQVEVDPPKVMLFTVRHDSRRYKFAKMLEKRAASYCENPKIRGP